MIMLFAFYKLLLLWTQFYCTTRRGGGEAEVNTGTSKRNTNDGLRSWWRSWSNINDKNGQNISWTQPNKHCFGSLAKWVLKKNNCCVECCSKSVSVAQIQWQCYLFLGQQIFVFVAILFVFRGNGGNGGEHRRAETECRHPFFVNGKKQKTQDENSR